MRFKNTMALALFVLVLPGLACAVEEAARAAEEKAASATDGMSAPATDEEKTLYAVGLTFAQQIQALGFEETEVDFIQAGLVDGLLGHTPKAELQTYGPKIDALFKLKQGAANEKAKAAGKIFLDEAAAKDGAVVTETGLIYLELQPGTGENPTPTSTVKVHYTGTFPDGRVFDSSHTGGQPIEFALNRVVPCFQQGITRMKVGGSSKLYCPSDLAYGDRGMPPTIPPGAVLSFEVELLGIVGTP